MQTNLVTRSAMVLVASFAAMGPVCLSAAAQDNPGFVLQTPHFGSVGSIVSSQKCTLAASVGASDNSIRVYDTIENRLIGVIGDGRLEARAAAFMNDEQYLAVATNQDVQIVTTLNGKVVATYQPPELAEGEALQSVALSPDDRLIAAGTNTGHLLVWDRPTGQIKHSFEMGKRDGRDVLHFVAFTPDGMRVVATGGVGARVGVFDLTKSSPDRFWETGHITVESAALSSDGTTIALAGMGASGTNAPTATLWNLSTGKRLGSLLANSLSAPSIRFVGEGNAVHVATGDSISVFSSKTLKREKQYKVGAKVVTMAKTCGHLMSFERSGLVYDFNSSKPKASKFVGSRYEMLQPELLMEDSSGRVLIGSVYNNSLDVSVLDLSSGGFKPLRTSLNKAAMSIHVENATADGRMMMLSVSSDVDAGLLFDTMSGKVVKSVPFPGYVGNAHVFPDGQRILVSGYDSPSLIESTTSKDQTPFPVKSIDEVLFHPSLPLMAVTATDDAGSQTLSVWDTKGLNKIAQVAPRGGSGDNLAFTPDGKAVVVFSYSQGVSRLDIASAKLVQPYGDFFAAVAGAISRSGSAIVAATQDGQLKVWDTITGKVVRQWQYPGTYVTGVTFAESDAKIVTAHSDSSIRIWLASDGSLLTTSRLLRNGAWVAQTADGYFATSAEPTEIFAIVSGGHSVPPGNLLSAYDKPEMIRQRLAIAQSVEAPPAASSSSGIVIDKKPTHVVAERTQVRSAPAADAQALQTLDAGNLLNVVGPGEMFSLVAKDGSLIGYVATSSLLKLQ